MDDDVAGPVVVVAADGEIGDLHARVRIQLKGALLDTKKIRKYINTYPIKGRKRGNSDAMDCKKEKEEGERKRGQGEKEEILQKRSSKLDQIKIKL